MSEEFIVIAHITASANKKQQKINFTTDMELAAEIQGIVDKPV